MFGIKKISLFALFFLVFSVRAFAVIPSPIGKWVILDDETHKPRTVVNITLNSQDKLDGRIVKAFYRSGEGPHDVCDKCTDPEYKNKRILGMKFMWGFTVNPSEPLEWSNGYILDPTQGKIYRCNLNITPDGQKLKVRGYIGISLLGRTQTWIRARAHS